MLNNLCQNDAPLQLLQQLKSRHASLTISSTGSSSNSTTPPSAAASVAAAAAVAEGSVISASGGGGGGKLAGGDDSTLERDPAEGVRCSSSSLKDVHIHIHVRVCVIASNLQNGCHGRSVVILYFARKFHSHHVRVRTSEVSRCEFLTDFHACDFSEK